MVRARSRRSLVAAARPRATRTHREAYIVFDVDRRSPVSYALRDDEGKDETTKNGRAAARRLNFAARTDARRDSRSENTRDGP